MNEERHNEACPRRDTDPTPDVVASNDSRAFGPIYLDGQNNEDLGTAVMDAFDEGFEPPDDVDDIVHLIDTMRDLEDAGVPSEVGEFAATAIAQSYNDATLLERCRDVFRRTEAIFDALGDARQGMGKGYCVCKPAPSEPHLSRFESEAYMLHYIGHGAWDPSLLDGDLFVHEDPEDAAVRRLLGACNEPHLVSLQKDLLREFRRNDPCTFDGSNANRHLQVLVFGKPERGTTKARRSALKALSHGGSTKTALQRASRWPRADGVLPITFSSPARGSPSVGPARWYERLLAVLLDAQEHGPAFGALDEEANTAAQPGAFLDEALGWPCAESEQGASAGPTSQHSHSLLQLARLLLEREQV